MFRINMLKNFDWVTFLIITFFLTIGFFFIWSAASEKFAYKQIIWITIGLVIFFGLLLVDYFTIARYSYVFYAIIIIGLLFVLLFGKSVYGAKRWLPLGPVSLQPSEFMKIVLVLALSRYMMFKENVSKFRNLIIPLFLTIFPMVLIMKQPDLGTSLVMLPIFLSIIFIAGVKLRYFFSIIILGLTSIPFLWYLILKDYQKSRVITFLWPDQVSNMGEGYHKVQSLIAVGSGGNFGSGWGNGIQSQLNFIPEGHTDFIFSVIAEEWGFFRSCAILVSYILFFACSTGIALKTREAYGRLIVTGFTAMFATQALVNIAMTMGLAPITGLTLPFISYGGSSLLSSFIALSFIFNVRLRTRVALARDEFYE
ncbi:MAG: rod shape-determining protein RodA [Candidatus Scalindua sp.]|nr:rod shape-determining protein RodA [Candidatus Scalindua sp.]